MPITALFDCFTLLGLFLLMLVAPASVVLLLGGEKRAALRVLRIPAGIIGLSVLATILVLVMMWLYGVRLSRNPACLFEVTFGFTPPPGTELLETYAELGVDWENRVMTFRAPKDVIDRICAGKFALSGRKTCTEAYRDNAHNLPDPVRLWSLPAVENADRFYFAKPFDNSFSLVNEAILCYSEKTGVAYFHWVGVD